MSIMSGFRDTLASLALEQALGRLRDEQIERLLAGAPLSDEQLRQSEKTIAMQLAQHYWGEACTSALAIPSVPDVVAAYAARCTVASDAAVLLTHRILCQIPVVGDPAHDLP